MQPASPVLTIHYRRADNDLSDYALHLAPFATAAPTHSLHQVSPDARSSFGAVFRLPLLLLPYRSISIRAHHPSPRAPPTAAFRPFTLPTAASTHIFLLEGHPHPRPSPTDFPLHASHLPRLLPLTLPASAASAPWLLLTASSGTAEIFPPTPPCRVPGPVLFLLDQAQLPGGSRLHITPVDAHDDAVTTSSLEETSPSLTLPQSLPQTIARTSPDDQHIITTEERPIPLVDLVAAQSDACELLSRLEVCEVPSPCSVVPPPEDARPHSSRPALPTLTVTCKMLPTVPPPEVISVVVAATSLSLLVKKLPSTDSASATFSIDVSAVQEEVLAAGLRIGTYPTSPEVHTWTPPLGLHVCILQTYPSPLPLSKAEIVIFYHRYGAFADWSDWELHIWTDASSTYPGHSTMVTPERPLRDGVVRFDLSELVFPRGAIVHAEPVKMKDHPARTGTNELGEEFLIEGYRDAIQRDVVRTWKASEDLSGMLHIVHGNKKVMRQAPLAARMEQTRWFRLRYRRYLPGDYAGWDLWTWDHVDPDSNRIAVAPVPGSEQRAWVDFIIDREKYGSSAVISFVPRRGGDAWKDRDEPVRTWTPDLFQNMSVGLELDVPTGESSASASTGQAPVHGTERQQICTFLIAQGTPHIFCKLEEARRMLVAYVRDESSVVVRAPVPVSWLSPPKRGRPQAIAATEVKLCDHRATSLLEEAGDFEDVPGNLLHFRKVQEVSPTESRLVFDKTIAQFHEDFQVERLLLKVPGFNVSTVSWKMHEDWDMYLYEGSLGWEYEPSRCSFRCFAPTADLVNLVLYNSPTGKEGRRVIPMRRIPQGCWKVIVHEDLKGKYYKLLANGENKRLFPGVEVIDPYSRCNTGHTGRGFIFGTEHTQIHPRPNIQPHETIVYELHIRDVTVDENSGILHRGKFMGLTERGTTLPSACERSDKRPLTAFNQEPMPGVDEEMQELNKLSTALDHIVQMGVNTIQILPIQDFDNDETDHSSYKWGYMPVHFNCPDGWYASSTTSVARVTEFKKLVDAVHGAGLKVIMDVVYNHTAEDSNEFNLDARFSFNGLAPRYYYRTCGNTPVAHTGESTCGMRKPEEPRCGECYSNGSGCGNEFRSESPMGRKFILDSLKFWATEYCVDGFRFDLLGLIDVDTLEQAASELRAIDSRIMIYGEPWSGGLSPIKITDKGTQRSKGFGVFNNSFRDAIRGSPFGAEETFVMDGGRLTEVKSGIVGSVDDFCDSPLETINYVECHDNYTLWDHMRFYIRSRTDEIIFTENDMRRMNRLAATIVLTSQGIPFVQAGQEMCRTKFDVENSYESPDQINMVRWNMKQSEWSTVQYYRGLILLRRSHPEIFCKQTAEEVRKSLIFYEDLGLAVPERCIAYRVLGDPNKLKARLKRTLPDADELVLSEESSKWSAVVVLLNPTPAEVSFELPGKEEDAIWIQIVDSVSAGTRSLQEPLIGYVAVQGRSACLLRRASQVEEGELQLARRLASVSDSYSSFHGDDPLSNYAVGLHKEMDPEEREQRRNLVVRRQQFEKHRVITDRQGIFVPSQKITETKAIETLDTLHGKNDSKPMHPNSDS